EIPPSSPVTELKRPGKRMRRRTRWPRPNVTTRAECSMRCACFGRANGALVQIVGTIAVPVSEVVLAHRKDVQLLPDWRERLKSGAVEARPHVPCAIVAP